MYQRKALTASQVAAKRTEVLGDVLAHLREQGHDVVLTEQRGLEIDGYRVTLCFSEHKEGIGFRTNPTGTCKLQIDGVSHHLTFDRVFAGRTFKERKDGSFATDKIAAYLRKWLRHKIQQDEAYRQRVSGRKKAEADYERLKRHPALSELSIAPGPEGLVVRTPLTYEQALALCEATAQRMPKAEADYERLTAYLRKKAEEIE